MKRVIVLTLTLALILCGCDMGYSRNSAGAQGCPDLLQLVMIAVPHNGPIDLRLDSVEVYETDQYGRRLFRYYVVNVAQTCWIVAQKTENDHIFYYEDLCYILCPGNVDALNTESMQWIKDQNDWNQPLNEGKMVSVVYSDEPNDALTSVPAIRKCVNRYTDAMYSDKYSLIINGLEYWEDCYQLLLISIHVKNKESDYYLAVYDCSEGETISKIKKIEDIDNIRQEVIDFKAEVR